MTGEMVDWGLTGLPGSTRLFLLQVAWENRVMWVIHNAMFTIPQSSPLL